MKDIEKVSLEIQRSREKYDYFNSTHEVYGVLFEEVEEFFPRLEAARLEILMKTDFIKLIK